jgi:ribonuclease VapC
MVVDTSAIVAILLGESGLEALLTKLTADPRRLVSAATALESALVIEAKRGREGGRDFDLFLHEGGFEIVAVTADHYSLAREAWRRFGKGRHAAGLNICDCLAYALAKATGEPLLFVGNDFSHTDIATA